MGFSAQVPQNPLTESPGVVIQSRSNERIGKFGSKYQELHAQCRGESRYPAESRDKGVDEGKTDGMDRGAELMRPFLEGRQLQS